MFLDTTIIVELMRGDEGSQRVKAIMKLIESELWFISVAQLGEVNDWCLANSRDPARRLEQLKDLVIVIPLNEDICVEASLIKQQMKAQKVAKFSLMDGFILASARHIGQRVLTTDTDFRKASDVTVLP
jgi:predicted nucleic acid-binding protein